MDPIPCAIPWNLWCSVDQLVVQGTEILDNSQDVDEDEDPATMVTIYNMYLWRSYVTLIAI